MLVRYRYLERLEIKKYYKGKNFNKFLRSGYFIGESEKEKFETKLKKLLNNREFISVSSGTNAIYLIFRLLKLKKNDEVVVPCVSWFSSFTAVKMIGCKVIGCDIDQNLQLDFESLKSTITKKTKAVLFVHFGGLCKDLEKFKIFLKKKKILLIEDCAQSFGTKINNIYSGSFGEFSAFSMNPMKVYGCLGEAGGIGFRQKKFNQKLKLLRYAGIEKGEFCKEVELNHKIDNIHCYTLGKHLINLKKIIKKRIYLAKLYDTYLTDSIVKPVFKKDFSHNYYNYTIRTKRRPQLIKYLKKNKIETKINHKYLISDFPPFRKDNKKKFIKSKKVLSEILSLPIDENLKKSEIFYIINKINFFFKS